jgi:hypothetical protein
MKLIKLLAVLFLTPVVASAETTWYVFISTTPFHFEASSERKITSTDTVKIDLPAPDPILSCFAWAPYYFQPEGFPYPLVVHRYLECYLGKNFALAAEVGCILDQTEVKDTELLLQTPNFLYGISFQCSNFVEGNNNEK